MVKSEQNCFGRVGQVIPGCECKLSDDGEILLRSPALMIGYYKQPELTARTIGTEGWLHTGDLGHIDDDGFLALVGRNKDLFKTAKGQYIAPSPIELLCQTQLQVDHIVLMGSGHKQPFLLVSLADTPYQNKSETFQDLCRQKFGIINQQLESHQKLSHVFICNDLWTPESGFLIPTLKIKRAPIEQHYLPILDIHNKNVSVIIS